jgi:predicted nucleic acid-binding Zn ribbon protein
MKDAPLKTCTCGQKGKVKRLPGGGAGIIFKGSGFYENDYRRRPAGNDSGKAASGKPGDSPVPTPVAPTPAIPSTTPAKT